MIVIDASIIVKWLKRDEIDSIAARLIYNEHKEGREKITVPPLVFIEVANYLATKSNSPIKHIKKLMSFLYRSKLEIYHVQEQDLLEATVLASRFKTSVYDMLYAVIAKRHKTILVTADERFIEKTKFAFVKLLSEYNI